MTRATEKPPAVAGEAGGAAPPSTPGTARDRAPGKKYTVNYTLDMNGEVTTIWLLRPEEIKNKPWPSTPAEAAKWQFDPLAQKWTKP